MNFLNTLRGPKLNVVPGEFHNQFVDEVLLLSTQTSGVAADLTEIIRETSSLYLLGAVIGYINQDASFLHNFLTNGAFDYRKADPQYLEYWCQSQLMKLQEDEGTTELIEQISFFITEDIQSVLNAYRIFHEQEIGAGMKMYIEQDGRLVQQTFKTLHHYPVLQVW